MWTILGNGLICFISHLSSLLMEMRCCCFCAPDSLLTFRHNEHLMMIALWVFIHIVGIFILHNKCKNKTSQRQWNDERSRSSRFLYAIEWRRGKTCLDRDQLVVGLVIIIVGRLRFHITISMYTWCSFIYIVWGTRESSASSELFAGEEYLQPLLAIPRLHCIWFIIYTSYRGTSINSLGI